MRKKQTKSVTMTMIAEEAGVSQSTVSRVLNGHPSISDEVRGRVIEMMRKLGYRDLPAPQILQKDQYQLALLMCPLQEQSNPFSLDYFTSIVSGINDILKPFARIQSQTLCADQMSLPDDFLCVGAVLVGYPNPELRADLRRRSIPYVIVSGDLETGPREDVVTVDNFTGGREACRYLLERGFRRIGTLVTPYNAERCAGIQFELERNGLSLRPEDCKVAKDTEMSSFVELIYSWSKHKDLPDAIFVSSYDVANVASVYFSLNHVKIPDQLVLFTVDHRPKEKLEHPCLHPEPYEMGRHAAFRLLEKLRFSDSSVCRIHIPMEVICPQGKEKKF